MLTVARGGGFACILIRSFADVCLLGARSQLFRCGKSIVGCRAMSVFSSRVAVYLWRETSWSLLVIMYWPVFYLPCTGGLAGLS